MDNSTNSKLTVHDNIWHFSVTDPQLHKKGFTIYKVTCKTFPIKSPEALTEIICWKRYNDFKTLYKSLLALHKALHRRDSFPEFAKPKLFGRFDETVIEERRQSAVDLLNFVTGQPHLYKSLIFRQFIDDGRAKPQPSQIKSQLIPDSTLDILSNTPPVAGNAPPDIVPIIPHIQSHRPLSQEGAAPRSEPVSENKEKVEKANEDVKGPSKDPVSEFPVLEGTWNFPQMADNISLGSSADDEAGDLTDDNDSILASSLLEADLAMFDPVLNNENSSVISDEDKANIPRTNSWLIKSLTICAEMDLDTDSNSEQLEASLRDSTDGVTYNINSENADSSQFPKPKSDSFSRSESNMEDSTSSDNKTTSGDFIDDFDPLRRLSQSSDGSKIECGKGDLDLSGHWQPRSASMISHGTAGFQRHGEAAASVGDHRANSLSSSKKSQLQDVSSRSQSFGSEKSHESDLVQSDASASSSTSKGLIKKLINRASPVRKPRSKTEQSVSSMDLGGKEDYIYLAASQICMAQNSEVNGDYEVAFAYYKSGVGILLQGVQGDTNKSRRDAVRRKTAQYLMKAEDLFNRHLSSENVDERRWGVDSFLSPSLDLDPSFAFIRGSVKELRNFQVLGTMDKVILVRDKLTDETFVIKSIFKSTPDTGRTQSILPTSCPFMVSLHKFYETDNAIYLLLQYASGGKLWNYIGEYFNSDRNDQLHGINLDNAKDRAGSQNIYSGGKVENDETVDDVVPNTQHDKKVNAHSDIKSEQTSDQTTPEKPQVVQTSGKVDKSPHVKERIRFSSLKRLISEDKESEDAKSVGGHAATAHSPKDKTEKSKPLDRRLSSLSDDSSHLAEGDSSVMSPASLHEEDHFQAFLHEHKRGANLEDFSINSVDSEDNRRLSSFCFDRINSIPEDGELPDTNPSPSGLLPVDHDEVFSTNDSAKEKEEGDSIVSAVNEGPVGENVDDVDDIVKNSKALLNNVDRLLSESSDVSVTQNEKERLSSDKDSSIYSKRASLHQSSTSNDSEEPSIYDTHRVSSEDDTTSSEKTVGSPTTSEGEKAAVLAVLSTSQNERNDMAKDVANNISTRERHLSADGETPSQPRLTCSSTVFKRSSTPNKLSLGRMDSKDMTRSASFECDIRSPTRNRARTVTDLFERLDASNQEQVRIPETSICKWMAHIVTALSRLHSLGIICRDLKPSNILLGDGGNVYLSYFCQLGHGDQDLDWTAVDELYAAPEIRSISGFDKSCDWWSLGALLYELIIGRSLNECHPGGVNSHTCLHIPSFVSNEARGLLEGLLTYNRHERLGSGMAGAEEIKAHPFFSSIDWHSLESS